jgi:hypothetical protein
MSNERQHVGNANDIGGVLAICNRCNDLPIGNVGEKKGRNTGSPLRGAKGGVPKAGWG